MEHFRLKMKPQAGKPSAFHLLRHGLASVILKERCVGSTIDTLVIKNIPLHAWPGGRYCPPISPSLRETSPLRGQSLAHNRQMSPQYTEAVHSSPFKRHEKFDSYFSHSPHLHWPPVRKRHHHLPVRTARSAQTQIKAT